MRSKLLIGLSFLIFLGCKSGPKAGDQVYMKLSEKQVLDGFWLYLPHDHSIEKDWPVILFLNGGMGVGPDPGTTKNEGPSRYIKEKAGSEQFIIINPHMKNGPRQLRLWGQHDKEIITVLNYVIREYNGDKNKTFLTGLSRGGHGSWSIAKKHHKKFQALVSIAGRLSCNKGCEDLEALPMWIVHNDGDPDVEVKHPRAVVNKLEETFETEFERNNEVKFSNADRIYTEIDSDHHDAWNSVYESPYFYEWLLSKAE